PCRLNETQPKEISMGNPNDSLSQTQTVAHWIAGHADLGSTQRTSPVYNPATGQVSAQVVLGGAAEVDAAVKAATAAFRAWSDTPPIRRARVMFRFLELLN